MQWGNVKKMLSVALLATPLTLATLPVGTAHAETASEATIRLIASSDLPVAGAAALISGDLVAGSEKLANRKLTVAITPVNATAPTKVRTVVTDKRGAFALAFRSKTSFNYTVAFDGDAEHDATASSARQAVKAKVSLNKTPVVRAGKKVVLRGRTDRALAGAKVTIRYGLKGAIDTVGQPPAAGVLATTKVARNGTFSVRVNFKKVGRKTIFAEVAKTSITEAGWTGYRVVSVRPAR